MWDSVAYNYCGFPTLVSIYYSFYLLQPLTDTDWTWYTNESAAMNKAYTISSKKIFPGEFMTWAQEGLDLAELYVYPGK